MVLCTEVVVSASRILLLFNPHLSSNYAFLILKYVILQPSRCRRKHWKANVQLHVQLWTREVYLKCWITLIISYRAQKKRTSGTQESILTSREKLLNFRIMKNWRWRRRIESCAVSHADEIWEKSRRERNVLNRDCIKKRTGKKLESGDFPGDKWRKIFHRRRRKRRNEATLIYSHKVINFLRTPKNLLINSDRGTCPWRNMFLANGANWRCASGREKRFSSRRSHWSKRK